MPALFAYLIAIALLLGGGYGALSWLAAPEPVKVAAKAKPKPQPHYEATPEATSPEVTFASEPSSTASDKDDQSAANDPPPTDKAEMQQAATAQPSRSADAATNADASWDEIKRYAESLALDARKAVGPPPHAASAVSPGSAQTTATAAPATRALKRPRLRQAAGHSEKPFGNRQLEMMVLRTIEFADGRRITRLIPYGHSYGGPVRDLAFDPDE